LRAGIARRDGVPTFEAEAGLLMAAASEIFFAGYSFD
jgi:hypothetical protein